MTSTSNTAPGGAQPLSVRKIITSGFSFSGSSAVLDLLLDNGAIAFPGDEVRIFSSSSSFSALTREVKCRGSASPSTIAEVIALLRGEAPHGAAYFAEAVQSSVSQIRERLGTYYDHRVDALASELHQSRKHRARIISRCRNFIDDLSNHFATLTGASTIVFDQGVRPWALNRMAFYGEVLVFVCMRDFRDQVIERMRHSIDNTGFEETLRSQTNRFRDLLARSRPVGSVIPVWFEDLVLDCSERRKVVTAAGLGSALRSSGHFNPVASRRNIGLYRLRPDLVPASTRVDEALLYSPPKWDRRILTTTRDYLRYGISARRNPAGAYFKTKDLRDIPLAGA